jgi:hypothetical protein
MPMPRVFEPALRERNWTLFPSDGTSLSARVAQRNIDVKT